MPTTLIDTCPLCGLRFSNMPLLELHIREDHRRPRVHRKDRPGDEDDGGSPEETEARRKISQNPLSQQATE